MAGRSWLLGRMMDVGLEPRLDGVGNVIGRWNRGKGPSILVGSHLDTVPEGGPFDGTLGVCAALEAVRAMQDAKLDPVRPIEVVSTADEEGRFGGMLGSQALCGEVDAAWIEQAVDDYGNRLIDAMVDRELDPRANVARDPKTIALFLELHVEQGPILEASGDAIGIVDAVSGVFNWTVKLSGAANHAGTTPMALRRDAFSGLAAFGASLDEIARAVGSPDTRLTIGKVDLRPNFPLSIAGEAVFSLVGRDIDEPAMRAVADACRRSIDEAAATYGLKATVKQQSWLPPTALHAGLADKMEQLALASGLATQRMISGAGHDAQTFARHVPAALVFVPSVGGVSHAPDETTGWPDIEAGATLLARAVATFGLAERLP